MFTHFAAEKDTMFLGCVVSGLLVLSRDQVRSTCEKLRSEIIVYAFHDVDSLNIRNLTREVNRCHSMHLQHARTLIRGFEMTSPPANTHDRVSALTARTRELFGELDELQLAMESVQHTRQVYFGYMCQLEVAMKAWFKRLSTVNQVGCWSVLLVQYFAKVPVGNNMFVCMCSQILYRHIMST